MWAGYNLIERWIVCIYCQHLGFAKEDQEIFTCHHCERTFKISERCRVHNDTTTCPKCLHVVKDKNFCECPECGYKWKAPANHLCHKCGVYGRRINLHTGEDFCLACGSTIDTSTSVSVIEDMAEG